ncbi:hypothetical protein ACXM2N_03550 [Corynebacterium sp. ZY180755]
MTKVSGDLRLVTNQPALVNQAWVRAVETRADGAGVIVDDLAPVLVQQGQVEFECAPGVAVLVLAYAGGVPAKTIPLVVAGDTQSLGDAVRAGQGVDGATQSALDALREDIAQTLADMRAEASAVDSVSAEVGEQLTGLAADAASSADAAAESATVAGEHASAAGASASAASASEQAAAGSAALAGEHATTADAASDSASASAQAAADSATLAGEHATAAGVSAQEADASAQAAATSADAAASAAADASTKAIADKVNELLEGAPEAYDTLKEIADTLEAHDDAASAMITQIAGKAAAKHTHTTGEISDASELGRQVLSAGSADEARAVIGAGTSSLVLGTTATTAAAGDHTHSTGQISGLDEALAGKAPASHTHTTAQIEGLDAILGGLKFAKGTGSDPDTIYFEV